MRTLAVVAALLLSADALACGQSTHVWIGVHAIDHLPDGPLKDLLADPAVLDAVINGAMFPDGGYSPITQDPYGETAHWEPYHSAYLAHLKATYPQPWTPEVKAKVAFLFGLTAHGMADQVYDGVYLTRSLLYDGQDAWGQYNVDHATDVAMSVAVGRQPVVADTLVPYDDLLQAFDDLGQPADKGTLRAGQASLQVAIQYVGNESEDPAVAADYMAQFPWANENLTDPDVPGSPACIGAVVAEYWQVMWTRLTAETSLGKDPVMWTWPADGAYDHPTDALSIESQVSLAFTRDLDEATVSTDRVTVTDADGVAHPVSLQHYYNSHVLNVFPEGDWAEDTTYTLTVAPGVASWDGEVIGEPWSMTFSTGPAPDTATGCARGPDSGGCATGKAGALAPVLGAVALWRRRRAGWRAAC